MGSVVLGLRPPNLLPLKKKNSHTNHSARFRRLKPSTDKLERDAQLSLHFRHFQPISFHLGVRLSERLVMLVWVRLTHVQTNMKPAHAQRRERLSVCSDSDLAAFYTPLGDRPPHRGACRETQGRFRSTWAGSGTLSPLREFRQKTGV